MKKKEYMTPEMEMVMIAMQGMLASSMPIGGETDVVEAPVLGGDDLLPDLMPGLPPGVSLFGE